MPSLSNSPRIRSAPQSRFCAAISLIKATVSADIFGLEDAALNLYFQNRRNPWRCHRRSVSGWTMKRACFQARTILARSSRSLRSVLVQAGRFMCRRRIISCWRRSAFSATSSDLFRSKSELVAENALLRQQLIILRRHMKRPACTKTDRKLLLLLARMVRAWKQALFIVQPETLLRWHRQGFRLFWKYKFRAASSKPKISAETVALIKEMAAQNRLWGAERIRGELLKLGIRVSKRTIQKYMRHARSPRRPGQNWASFLQNHAKDIWACDFLQVTDLFFRSLFAFFIIDLQSRKVIHVGVTRSPTDA